MDKTVAEKRLHDLVIEAQREAEGIVAPAAVREAAKAAFVDLLAEYKAELTGRELAARHVHDTTLRLARMVSALGWHRLADVREDRFAAWRAGLDCSAKTKKEYQVSANAFFNWLVRTGRLLTNPLASLTASIFAESRCAKRARLRKRSCVGCWLWPVLVGWCILSCSIRGSERTKCGR
jgi:hypothetical protein